MANARLVDFIRLSVDLTGMSEFRIIGTGNAETFLDLAVDRCGEETIAADFVEKLLLDWRSIG